MIVSWCGTDNTEKDNAALHSFALQCLAIQASYYGGTTTKQSLCDRIVRMGLAYENSSTQGTIGSSHY